MSKFLLITAHPDDECMFFTPTIRNLIRNGCEIELICLSTGDFDGKGRIRRRELKKSTEVLGIKPVSIIEDKELKDGPKNFWKAETILKHLSAVNPTEYSAIVTFDDEGVSGHPNHCSISEALKHQSDFKVLRLKTIPVWLNDSDGENTHILYTISMREAYEFGYKAMLQHESQLLWFRRLYLFFSVYMTVNILTNKK